MEANRYKLSLFVTPDDSSIALQNLYSALSILAYTDYELRLIDILEEPEIAQNAGIASTPTLVYHATKGDVIIESLMDQQVVRSQLGLPCE